MTAKTRKAWLLSVGILSVCVAVAIRGNRPILLRVPYHTNQLTGDANYVLFNPFRDRSPERAGAAYLEAMRRGDCPQASALAAAPKMPNDLTCEQLQNEYSQARSRFVQPLRDRRDANGETILYYSQTGYEGNWLALRNTRDGWKVVEFNKLW